MLENKFQNRPLGKNADVKTVKREELELLNEEHKNMLLVWLLWKRYRNWDPCYEQICGEVS